MKYLYFIVVLGILFLVSCGAAPSLSDAAILATADAIRARDVRELSDFEKEATVDAQTEAYQEFMADEDSRRATEFASYAEADATAEVWIMATENARVGAKSGSLVAKWKAKFTAVTATAEVAATETAWEISSETAEASYYATEEAWLAEEAATQDAYSEEIIATDMAMLTKEAGEVPSGCPGGCTTYPDWCAPPIKGNVSYESGERIYHMPGDEYYNDTVINPDYEERYFCAPEEAEAAGFRRAYR